MSGSGKADIVHSIVSQRQRLLSGASLPADQADTILPSARVASKQVRFLVDKEAASKIEQQQTHTLNKL